MKKLLFTATLMLALAATASAYVQVGHLPGDQPAAGTVQNGTTANGFKSGATGPASMVNVDPGVGSQGGEVLQPSASSDVVQPIPEPGTLTLAAMGLAALGAATRRRRSR